MEPTGLNPAQREAVLHERGPLVVLAGAGSGKTRVITHRLAHLVARGAHPARLLAVTFTNKAAGEMKSRAAALSGGELGGMWISTFHAAAMRILRQHAAHVGLPREFVLYDDDDQKKLLVRILGELGMEGRSVPLGQIRSRIDLAKNRYIRPDAYAQDDWIDTVVARAYAAYEQRLEEAGAVDFSGLLVKALDLVRGDDAVGRRLRERFDHVLVDEFQDSSPVQYELVRALAAGTRNLCVVGDDDQSIYRWRGADVANLVDFERDWPDAHVVKLEQNYRSTRTILAAANAVIARNPYRRKKTLFSENEEGEPIVLFEARSERDEAAFVASAIAQQIQEQGFSPADFAVFYRVHAQSRALEEALRARNLDYRIVGGTRFFERAEVKDLLGYLRILGNPADEVSLLRVVNVPARGIGDTSLEKVIALARAGGTTVLEALRHAAAGALSGAAAKKMGAFLALYDELRALAGAMGPADLAEAVLARTGYLDWLAARSDDGEARTDNLAELIGDMRAYEKEAGGEVSLADYLGRVALSSDDDGQAGAERVTLMTVHGAKGLEFPIVFLVGLEEGVFPWEGSLSDDEALAEERRLAYVAITRARKRLLFTRAAERSLHGRQLANPPSRFLADVPPERLGIVRREPAPRPAERAPRRPYAGDDVGEASRVEYDELDQRGDDECPFWEGQRVRHRLFGVGVVRGGSGAGEGAKLVVDFPDAGRKTIIARFLVAED